MMTKTLVLNAEHQSTHFFALILIDSPQYRREYQKYMHFVINKKVFEALLITIVIII